MAWSINHVQRSPKEIYEVVMESQVNPHMNQKLDNILNLLHNIDDRLKKDERKRRDGSNVLPSPSIPLPPIPTFANAHAEDKPKRPPPVPQQCKPLPPPPIISMSMQDSSPLPPPIPPKYPDAMQPTIGKDGGITFTASQLLCLTLQLKAVRMFIDDNFEDEYVDKELNMHCLDSAIRTLSGIKK